jgi:hypothetical protein
MTADSTIPSQAVVASQNNTSNGQPRTKICVYCGSAPGASPAHIEAARALGKAMAENNIDLGESLAFPKADRREPGQDRGPPTAASRTSPRMTQKY